MDICVIGNDSFSNIRVGVNHIAESLSNQGHKVDYITSPACFLTIFSKSHRKKYINSFKNIYINKNLREIVPVCIFPKALIKLVEESYLEKILFNINKSYIKSRNRYIENKKYDICIFSVSDSSYYFVSKIHANKFVYRHNDILEEFKVTPRIFVKYERYLLKNFPIKLVASVNAKLANYIQHINKNLIIKIIPNGINFQTFKNAKPDKKLLKTKNKNIVYIGVIEFWTNDTLIIETAKILKDYNFHIYTKWFKVKPKYIPQNVYLHGFIQYNKLPEKLKACSVGIIPFNKINETRAANRPLKYYQYLASNLGIASTSYGMDKKDKFICFGDTPKEFAQAILNAYKVKELYKQEKEEELKRLDWDKISKEIIK